MDLSPRDTDDVIEAVTTAAAKGKPLAVTSGNTKAAITDAPLPEHRLMLDGITGIIDYDPPELVLTARAGTPIAEIQTLVAAQGQMLAFEPMDHGPLFGLAPKGGTLGGIIAANVSGPRRLAAGAARDHVLGVEAVSGRGALFKAGGRVVKNVTGYDLPKLLAGSWGTLAVMTAITVKVLPRPKESATLVLPGLAPLEGARAMSRAMGAPAEISAAAYLPPFAAQILLGHNAPLTLLRLDGVGPSITARLDLLGALFGPHDRLGHDDTATLWAAIRDVTPFVRDERPLWRLSVPPMSGPQAAADLPPGTDWLMDWAGGLLWAATPPTSDAGVPMQRPFGRTLQGHATLIRANGTMRAQLPTFEPQMAALAKLSARVKAAFDPSNILNPGRLAVGRP